MVFAVFGAACSGSSTTDVAAPGAETAGGEPAVSNDGDADDTGSRDAATPADDAAAPTGDSDAGDDLAINWDHDWTGDLIGGGQIDANSLAGQDIVLWFWAPW